MSDLSKNAVMSPTTSNVSKSKFSTNPFHLTTFQGGDLVPIFVKPTLPNSEYWINLASVIKMPTLINEFYGKAYIDTYVFWCSERNLWDKFESFIGEGHDTTFSEDMYGQSGRVPSPSSVGSSIVPDLVKPYIDFTGFSRDGVKEHSIFNYLGIPLGVGNLVLGQKIDAMPYRLYNYIYNNYFRSPFLQDPLYTGYGQDSDSYSNFEIKKACKIPDYFTGYITTSPQLFSDISIGLTGNATLKSDMNSDNAGYLIPVGIRGAVNGSFYGGTKDWSPNSGSQTYGLFSERYTNPSSGSYFGVRHSLTDDTSFRSHIVERGGLADDQLVSSKQVASLEKAYADLSSVSGVTLTNLRNAFALQHISEKSLQGTDLKSLLRWAFGENLQDYEFDKPIYCGGSRLELNVNSVTQTTPSVPVENDNTTPLGYQAGQSKTTGKNIDNVRIISKEHGWIMVLVCVRQESVYEDGIDRNLTKKDRFDYYWRDFLGAVVSQEVLNQEIYFKDAQTDSQVFGFVPYAEHLRRDVNRISGYFSSASSSSLKTYHLGTHFTSLPYLESKFIESDAQTVFDRLIAVSSEKAHQFEGYFYFKFDKIVPIPVNNPIGLSVL